MQIDAAFVSDIHLGSMFSKSDNVISALKNYKFAQLYLVGDVIDGWVLNNKFSWSRRCNVFVQKILRYARHDVEVLYAIGNHDDFLYKFLFTDEHLQFGDIIIADQFTYISPSNKHYLVIHGHQFDFFCQSVPILSHLGSVGYEILLRLNELVLWSQKKFGFPKFKLRQTISNYAKRHAKNLIAKSHKECLKRKAQEQNCCGVIFGHTHLPELSVDEDGFEFINCGDWVESQTLVVCDQSGKFSLQHHEAQA